LEISSELGLFACLNSEAGGRGQWRVVIPFMASQCWRSNPAQTSRFGAISSISFHTLFLNFVFPTLSAAAFACASMVSSEPVGQPSNDDVESVAFFRDLCGSGRSEPAAAGTCSLSLSGDALVACKFHREALPQDLSAAQSVWALFVMAQLGGRLETASGLGPAKPTAS